MLKMLKINKRSNKVKMDSMKNDQAYLKKKQIETLEIKGGRDLI